MTTIRLTSSTFTTTIEIGPVRAAIIADALSAAGYNVTVQHVERAARAVRGSWTCPNMGTIRIPTPEGFATVGEMERSLLDWCDANVARNDRPRAWTHIMGHMFARYTAGNFKRPADHMLRAWVAPVTVGLRLVA